jgi:hypothetical protein
MMPLFRTAAFLNEVNLCYLWGNLERITLVSNNKLELICAIIMSDVLKRTLVAGDYWAELVA